MDDNLCGNCDGTGSMRGTVGADGLREDCPICHGTGFATLTGHLQNEIGRLADCIMDTFPHEIVAGEKVVDTAIKLIQRLKDLYAKD